MSLGKIFSWYTIGFLAVTILIGLAQALFGNRLHRGCHARQ